VPPSPLARPSGRIPGQPAFPEELAGGETSVQALEELRTLMLDMRAEMRELRDSLEELRRDLRALPEDGDSRNFRTR
jgi:hypothetical protein